MHKCLGSVSFTQYSKATINISFENMEPLFSRGAINHKTQVSFPLLIKAYNIRMSLM